MQSYSFRPRSCTRPCCKTGADGALKGMHRIRMWMTCGVAIWAAGWVAGQDLAQAQEAWPRFRGPGGSGVGASSFPTVFGPGSNLVWSVPAPPGHSSPCILGNRIWITGFETNQLLTLCLDRDTGRELWRRSLSPGKIERGAQLGNPATATACTDGQRVVVYFGAYGLASYGLDGRVEWTLPLPIPVTQHGAGTSPVLAGGRVLLNCDQDLGSYLLAVDAASGQVAWKVERREFRRGFATPLPFPSVDPTQVVVPGTLRLVSYNLADGTERWSVRGLPNEMVASAVSGDGRIYVAGWTSGSGVPRMPDFGGLLQRGDTNGDGRLSREEAPSGPAKQHFPYLDSNKDGQISREEYETVARAFDESKNVAMAVDPGGFGDVTGTRVVWRASRGLPYVPTPLFYEGRLYLVKNGGLVSCFDARTGAVFYQEERLETVGDYYASPVAAGGKICVASQPGTLVVYRAGPTLEVLARNVLGEPVLATPAIVNGRIYVRTASRLMAFGEH